MKKLILHPKLHRRFSAELSCVCQVPDITVWPGAPAGRHCVLREPGVPWDGAQRPSPSPCSSPATPEPTQAPRIKLPCLHSPCPALISLPNPKCANSTMRVRWVGGEARNANHDGCFVPELLAALFSARGVTQPAGSAFWGLCLSPSARCGDPTAGAGLVAACSGRWGRRAATSSRGTQTHLPALSSTRQRDGLKSPTLPRQLGRVVLSRLKIYLRAHYYAEQFFIHRESTAAF